MKHTLVALSIATASTLLAHDAYGQQFTAAPAEEAAVSEEVETGPVFGAGDFDILVNLGFNLLYLNVEPALDIGIVPLGGDMAISIGGGVGFGFCVLCAAVSAFSDANVKASNISPHGRVNLHLGTLGGALPRDVSGTTIDPYIGFMAGPNIYRFRLDFDHDDAHATATQTSIFGGPAAGIRAGFANNTIVLFAEYRLTAEFGFATVTIEDSDGNSYNVTGDAYSQRSSNLVLGLGLRI